MAKRRVQISKKIKAAQKNRIRAAQKRLAKKLEARLKKAAAVPVTPVVKPKPVAKPKAETKKTKRVKPLNGDSAWIMTPAKVVKLSLDELVEKYNGRFNEMRELGKQYDVKGPSKVDLAHDILRAAKKMV